LKKRLPNVPTERSDPMHDRLIHDTSNCSVARTLEIVGEKWTILILREAIYGVTRFAEFQKVLGCPRNLLADRLRMLTEHGIFKTQPYKEPGDRARQQYVFTEKGGRLVPAVLALMQWGDEYLADAAGPAVHIDHRVCGHHVRLQMVCDAGHLVQSVEEVEVTPGPAFRLLTASRE
jgi:DNA-binding HxlR family transcriptional regulator